LKSLVNNFQAFLILNLIYGDGYCISECRINVKPNVALSEMKTSWNAEFDKAEAEFVTPKDPVFAWFTVEAIIELPAARSLWNLLVS
jgi:hypothetical protein